MDVFQMQPFNTKGALRIIMDNCQLNLKNKCQVINLSYKTHSLTFSRPILFTACLNKVTPKLNM